ncbi:MAG: hypothetical protein RIK87_20270 [Fuerstiella sp.]
MWRSKSKHPYSEPCAPDTTLGVLNEQTFWQIVHTEKERARRSDVPITLAIFAVQNDTTNAPSSSNRNMASLSRLLRSEVRMTDHVGVAGPNELGVVLWGARRLGAYRFVRRLGSRAAKLADACRLFVYPTLTQPAAGPDNDDLELLLQQCHRMSRKATREYIAVATRSLAESLHEDSAVQEQLNYDTEPSNVDYAASLPPGAGQRRDEFGRGAGSKCAAPVKSMPRAATNRPWPGADAGSSGRSGSVSDLSQMLHVSTEPLDNLLRDRPAPEPPAANTLAAIGQRLLKRPLSVLWNRCRQTWRALTGNS